MTEIDPFIRVLVFREVADIGLPGGYCLREEHTPILQRNFENLLKSHGAPESITNIGEFVEEFFNELAEAEVFMKENFQFAGTYYAFNKQRYDLYRTKSLEGNEISANADRLGGRYFRDTFAGYLKQQSLEDVEITLRGDLPIPASDRIVSLGDNAKNIIKEIETLKDAVRSHNDEDGKLTGSRERIASELSAGQELLKAPSVRVKAIMTVLVSTLHFIAQAFAGGIIGDLAVKLIEQLGPLLGF